MSVDGIKRTKFAIFSFKKSKWEKNWKKNWKENWKKKG
jgi:hypothetical protein